MLCVLHTAVPQIRAALEVALTHHYMKQKFLFFFYLTNKWNMIHDAN